MARNESLLHGELEITNSNKFFQLVADFQKNIDWLNQVLKGDYGHY